MKRQPTQTLKHTRYLTVERVKKAARHYIGAVGLSSDIMSTIRRGVCQPANGWDKSDLVELLEDALYDRFEMVKDFF